MVVLSSCSMVFSAYAKHSDKNFLGISSCDALISPMRQTLLFLTERIFEARRVGAESQTIRPAGVSRQMSERHHR